MTKQERLATMRALQDILQARRSATFGGGMSNIGGAPPQIPVDPRLNKPQPPGGGGKQAVHDPNNILDQRQSTPVQLPDDQQPVHGDEGQDDPNGPDIQGGDTPNNQPPSGGTGGDTGDDPGDFPTEGGGVGGEGTDSQNGKQPPAENKKANQDDDEFAVYKSPDYKKGWNSIIAKYDRDDVTEQELQDLISQIESGILQI